jgi:hypothetical protein
VDARTTVSEPPSFGFAEVVDAVAIFDAVAMAKKLSAATVIHPALMRTRCAICQFPLQI